MELIEDIGNQAIQEVLARYPGIGPILQRRDVGCVTCKVGICLLKDVVAIHGLTPEAEKEIETEINALLERR